jgi:hypothetical protein
VKKRSSGFSVKASQLLQADERLLDILFALPAMRLSAALFACPAILDYRKIRDAVDDKVLLRPVRSVAGARAKYASGEIPLEKIRDKVWQED